MSPLLMEHLLYPDKFCVGVPLNNQSILMEHGDPKV